MTEPKPETQYRIRESDVQGACRDLLKTIGFKVFTISQDRPTRKQLEGLSDLIAVRHNVTLFIECKRLGGKLRKSQEKFRDKILPHIGPNLHYWVIDDVDKLVQALRRFNLA